MRRLARSKRDIESGAELAAEACCSCAPLQVVVNDLGGGLKGETTGGEGKRVADVVVDAIVAAGGKAVANYDSVRSISAIAALCCSAALVCALLLSRPTASEFRTTHCVSTPAWALLRYLRLLSSALHRPPRNSVRTGRGRRRDRRDGGRGLRPGRRGYQQRRSAPLNSTVPRR